MRNSFSQIILKMTQGTDQTRMNSSTSLMKSVITTKPYYNFTDQQAWYDGDIDVLDAEYFSFTFGANITLTFSNWPVSDRFAKVRVDVKTDGTARTVNFATTSGTVITDADTALPLTMTTDIAARHIFDAWTTNGGNTVFVKYLGLFN
jgi:hypothetical protein